MPTQSYELSYGLCLNNYFQGWFIGNKRYQVQPFIYINWADEAYNLVRGRKLLGDMKYSMRPVKRASEAVGIWTKENWDVKRVNLGGSIPKKIRF